MHTDTTKYNKAQTPGDRAICQLLAKEIDRALADTGKSAVPIIAMSAHVFRNEIDAHLGAGMDAFIGKPISPAGLERVLAQVLLGEADVTPEKLAPYECGVPPVGDARERQSVKFYLVAMIFLLFDIEIAFLYPWAVALRDLGWFGFFQILTFFLILTVGYLYVWRKGVLDWGRQRSALLPPAEL